MMANTKELEQAELDFDIETKSERWQRLANYRYVKAVERIRMLSTLGNNNNYEYTSEEVERLFGSLRAEVDKAEQAFHTKDDSDVTPLF